MPQPKPGAGSRQPEFLWGAATAAHQVEGNQHNNWSVWEASVADELAQNAPKRLENVVANWEAIKAEACDPSNYISGIASDHYNRFIEDFGIMDQLGLNAYRFSIEWSRIEPEPGVYDQKELKHYQDMVTQLGRRGIEPLVTLHHFTDPVWLEERGGWHGKEAVERFAAFAKVTAKNLGDVRFYCTINEPGSYLLMRYLGGGAWPKWPGLSFNPIHGYKYLKNVIRAHQAAAAGIKEVNSDAQVGLAHGMLDYQLGRRDPLSWITKKQLEYIPDSYLLNRLKGTIDFIGVNYYMRMMIKSGFSHPANWAVRSEKSDAKLSDMGWGLYPEGIYNVTQKLKKYGLPLYITENGIADASDKLRLEYIETHLNQLQRSKADGADIRGYFYWSLLDNYEWSEGFWPKFGLVKIDRKDQKRTVRPSARQFSNLIKKHPLS